MNAPDRPTHNCPACAAPNEMPYVFCEACGAARLHLGGLRISLNLSLATLILLGTWSARTDEYLVDFLLWDWPVYLLYAGLALQFVLMLGGAAWSRTLTILGWGVGFVLAGLAFFELRARFDFSFVYQALADLPDLARDHPLPFFATGGGVVLAVSLVAWLRWAARFGRVMAYRVVVLLWMLIAALLWGALALLATAHGAGWLGAATADLRPLAVEARPDFDKALVLALMMLGRLFAIELFVVASVRGYARARKLRVPTEADAPGESPLVRALLPIAATVRRIAFILERMVAYIVSTLIELLRDLLHVLAVLTKELVVPAAALAVFVAVLGGLAGLTRAYIESPSVAEVGLMLGAPALGLAAMLLFLVCKTSLRWGRMTRVGAQLVAWLVPNLLIFFVLMSLLLYASSAAVNRIGLLEQPLPFRPGPLTAFAGVVLVAMVLTILLRKGGLARLREAGEEVADERAAAVAPRVAEGEDAPAGEAAEAHEPAPGRWGALAETIGLTRSTRGMQELARSVGEQMKGRPAVVEQLEKARRQVEAKRAQLEALEATRGSVSHETYEPLHTEYTQDLRYLEQERDRLQVRLHELLAAKLRERAKLDTERRALERRREELEQLGAGGAIPAADFRARMRKLKPEVEALELKLQSCLAQVDYLKPHSTVSEGELLKRFRPGG